MSLHSSTDDGYNGCFHVSAKSVPSVDGVFFGLVDPARKRKLWYSIANNVAGFARAFSARPQSGLAVFFAPV
jgi:hypothetical protein